MKFDVAAVRKCLKAFDFETLFREYLGWDNHQAVLDIPLDGQVICLNAVAHKHGFVAFLCPSIPDRATRLKIDHQVTKSAREHFVIYADQPAGQQVWQWVRREPGKPLASRDHRFYASQTGDPLIQRLEQIAVSLEEEDEKLTVVDVAGRARAAFDVDRVTKKFYDRFKTEHAAFLKLIKGIKADADLQWYTSLMLNRLMFVYFIQKKGFLDGDADYLRNRLKRVQQIKGKDKFQSFYRYFLLRLFHDGLGTAQEDRKLDAALEKLLGQVPYLNGGFFEVHQLEEHNPEIDIPDRAFEKLFDFFDQYSWHLDERPLRADNEINPDVVGYIFEKYINQKQMGAYYTKEDITEYISKNTIIPFLFDAAEKTCAIAFKPDSALWRLLCDDPDRYLYPAVRHGVVDDAGHVIPLPEDIEAGIGDVARREGWNRPASDPFALPTETWREHVARRQRCLDIREKLRRGEVHQVNDLITLNLDIWQFARDAIVHAEGPELLRAFWQAIGKVTVLDPTCGSGAFLFAALRILETLYSDCLERMARFVEDLDGKPHHPKQYGDFKAALARIALHPNDRYFILKSIIINNLFGVDIMEEAVEICKLRLFLKLVAQVETAGQIEPLPDIDFNIRSGNTLVGYTSLDQVRKSQEGKLGFWEKDIRRIEEDAEMVDKAFRQFRAQQTTHGGKVTAGDKQELRTRLAKLAAELDRYLAGEYGVRVEKQKDFDAWKASHEPFHWFVEFYGIMHTGGFDVIIGNPPYVEYSKIKKMYTIQNYSTESCGNLYAYVLERCFLISKFSTYCGMIVPLSVATTERMQPLQYMFSINQRWLWMSHFDVYPCKLFEGAKQRLTILITGRITDTPVVFTTRYNRWWPDERDTLMPNIYYGHINFDTELSVIPKAPCRTSISILKKIARQRPLQYSESQGSPSFYVHRIPYNYIKAFNFVPYFWNEVDGEKKSEDYKPYRVAQPEATGPVLAILNSNLFFWWWYTLFEGYHCGKHEIYAFPVGLNNMAKRARTDLETLALSLMKDIKEKKNRKICRYKSTGEVHYDEFFPRLSKDLIDRLDQVLAKHYGFTDEELDFIINYDIKYRMGRDAEEGDE